MELVYTSVQLRAVLNKVKSNNKTIGFVPTMGALHDGHLSLVKKAKQSCDYVLVSIYVNPTQFNEQSDLEKYPRTLEADSKLLEEYCDLIFNPRDNSEVYGESISLKAYDFGGLDAALEGAFRPGHFEGMANVVSRLFHLVTPNKAFFGLKDYQQFILVKKMVEIDEHTIEVIGCPIIREKNGLAMSSRNQRLSAQAKDVASVIYYGLDFCKRYSKVYGVKEIQEIAKKMINGIVDVEYLEFRDAHTLEEITRFNRGQEVFLSFAGFIEDVRLIDNIRFKI